MKIGINLDGVLINKTAFQYKYGLEYFNNNLRYVNECAYSFRRMFNCSEEEENDFWNRYRFNYYTKTKPEDYSLECLKKLRENGHQILLIASREYLNNKNIRGSLYRYLLNNWLRHNNIPYDGIIYCDNEYIFEEEMKVCAENEIDLLLEDSISSSIVISNICEVLLFNRPYNIGLSCVTRVNNFNEVLDIIEKKGKEKVKK